MTRSPESLAYWISKTAVAVLPPPIKLVCWGLAGGDGGMADPEADREPGRMCQLPEWLLVHR